MKIKHWMTKDPVTIGPETPITEAARLMKERGIHRLPVLEDGRLVGLITYRMILEAQPSPATSLSVHEIRYLSAQILVRDVMKKNPVTVSPEDRVIPVLLLGRERGIGSFPVLEDGRLVGIITASDLFELFLDILGRETESGLIGLAPPPAGDRPEAFPAALVEPLTRAGIPLLAFFSLADRREPSFRHYFLRAPGSQLAAAEEALRQAGLGLKDWL